MLQNKIEKQNQSILKIEAHLQTFQILTLTFPEFPHKLTKEFTFHCIMILHKNYVDRYRRTWPPHREPWTSLFLASDYIGLYRQPPGVTIRIVGKCQCLVMVLISTHENN